MYQSVDMRIFFKELIKSERREEDNGLHGTKIVSETRKFAELLMHHHRNKGPNVDAVGSGKCKGKGEKIRKSQTVLRLPPTSQMYHSEPGCAPRRVIGHA